MACFRNNTCLYSLGERIHVCTRDCSPTNPFSLLKVFQPSKRQNSCQGYRRSQSKWKRSTNIRISEVYHGFGGTSSWRKNTPDFCGKWNQGQQNWQEDSEKKRDFLWVTSTLKMTNGLISRIPPLTMLNWNRNGAPTIFRASSQRNGGPRTAGTSKMVRFWDGLLLHEFTPSVSWGRIYGNAQDFFKFLSSGLVEANPCGMLRSFTLLHTWGWLIHRIEVRLWRDHPSAEMKSGELSAHHLPTTLSL